MAQRIIRNRARCRRCGTTIASATRHDFVMCKCGAVGVDGGRDYLRRVGQMEDLEEMSESVEVPDTIGVPVPTTKLEIVPQLLHLPIESGVHYETRKLSTFYTPMEVAQMLKVSLRTIRREVNDGKLKCVVVRGQPRFSQQEIDRYLANPRTT